MLKVRVKINKIKRELDRPVENKKRTETVISPFRPKDRHNPVDETRLKHALATEIDNLKALEMKVKSIQWEQKLNQSLIASRKASPQPALEDRREEHQMEESQYNKTIAYSTD